MLAPPLTDPRWAAWAERLRPIEDKVAWCKARGLNDWTICNLLAAIDLVEPSSIWADPVNFDDEMPRRGQDVESVRGRDGRGPHHLPATNRSLAQWLPSIPFDGGDLGD